MLLDGWEGAAVAAADGAEPPSPDEWTPVELPGRPGRFAGEDAVAYRTRFADPRTGDDARALLELEGLYAHADVWLNGDHLGSHHAYFRPARFTVDPDEENELVVVCRRPDRFGGVYETDEVPDDQAVPAIWWGARVEPKPAAFVADLTVSPDRSGDGARIVAALTVDAAEPVDERATFSLRPEGFRGGGMMERARVQADAGERVTVEKAIEVRDPKRWWPRDDGPQSRYTVRAKMGDDAVEESTGLRTVSYTDDGLLVNGKRLRVRGFNLLPSDDPAADVERAVEANANFVRVHAHVPHPDLWAAADEAGLLVWQDMPLTGGERYDADRAAAIAEDLVAMASRHPSVGLYGVHDDPAAVTDDLAGAWLAKTRLKWRAWRASGDGTTAATLAESFPETAAVFPVVGEPGTGAAAASLYPGWRFGDAADVDWLLDWQPHLGDVVAEFGAGALGSAEPSETAGFDEHVHAQHVPSGDVDASQAYQARVVKTVAERLRRNGTDALAAYALRDTADAGMGVLARDGDPKQAYDAVAQSFEPVQAVLHRPGTGTTDVTVVNDTSDDVAGTLSWSAGDESGTADVSVAARASEQVATVPVPGGADAVDLTLSLADRTVTNRYHL
ncbi:hydrolase [Halobacteriaceae archaeon GCM10025711]